MYAPVCSRFECMQAEVWQCDSECSTQRTFSFDVSFFIFGFVSFFNHFSQIMMRHSNGCYSLSSFRYFTFFSFFTRIVRTYNKSDVCSLKKNFAGKLKEKIEIIVFGVNAVLSKLRFSICLFTAWLWRPMPPNDAFAYAHTNISVRIGCWCVCVCAILYFTLFNYYRRLLFFLFLVRTKLLRHHKNPSKRQPAIKNKL